MVPGGAEEHCRYLMIQLLVLVVGAVVAQGSPMVGVATSVLGFLVMMAGAWLFLSGRPGSEEIPGIQLPATPARPGGPGWNRFRRRFEHPDE